MRRSLFLAFLLLPFLSIAQSNFSLKVYGNLEYERDGLTQVTFNTVQHTNLEARNWEIGWLSLAANWSKANGHEQEVELVRLSFSGKDDTVLNNQVFGNAQEPLEGSLETNFVFDTRYQYRIPFAVSEESGLTLGAAFGARMQVSHRSFQPKTSAGFPFQLLQFGATLELTPYVQQRVSDRIALEAAIPLGFLRSEWTRSRLQDPRLSQEQQINYTSELNSLNGRFSARLGLVVYL